MRKKIIDLHLNKNGMDHTLTLKAAPEIEEFFKKAAKRVDSEVYTERSSKWFDQNNNGLVFYIKNESLSSKVANHAPIMDNFGSSLLDSQGRINLALLRIVGLTDGVTIKTDELLSLEEIKQYSEMLGTWAKSFYEENLRTQDLSAEIHFEF